MVAATSRTKVLEKPFARPLAEHFGGHLEQSPHE